MVFLWQLPTVINFSQGSFANATPKHLRNRRRWRGSAVQERTFRALDEEGAITSCAPSFNLIPCGIPSVWCLSVMTAARSALFLPPCCLWRSLCHGALHRAATALITLCRRSNSCRFSSQLNLVHFIKYACSLHSHAHSLREKSRRNLSNPGLSEQLSLGASMSS